MHVRYRYIIVITLLISIFGINIHLPFSFSRTLILFFFYGLGRYIKDKELIEYILLLLGYTTIANYNVVSLSNYQFNNKFIFYICAIICSIILICFSKVLLEFGDNYFIKKIIYIGKNSMYILLFHFLSFKFVILIQLLIIKGSFVRLFDYFPYYINSGCWSMIYVFAGVYISILIGNLISKIEGRIYKK